MVNVNVEKNNECEYFTQYGKPFVQIIFFYLIHMVIIYRHILLPRIPEVLAYQATATMGRREY